MVKGFREEIEENNDWGTITRYYRALATGPDGREIYIYGDTLTYWDKEPEAVEKFNEKIEKEFKAHIDEYYKKAIAEECRRIKEDIQFYKKEIKSNKEMIRWEKEKISKAKKRYKKYKNEG